jgi:hypothetical protein
MLADNMLGSLKAHGVRPISGVFTSQSVRNPNSGAPQIHGLPQIRGWEETLIRHIVAVTGPTCAVLLPLLHRKHKFRSAFSTI